MKTKAELLAYIEQHFEDTDLIYVPSFITRQGLQYEINDWHEYYEIPELIVTPEVFASIIDIYENIDYVWEGLDDGLRDAVQAHVQIENQNAGKN